MGENRVTRVDRTDKKASGKPDSPERNPLSLPVGVKAGANIIPLSFCRIKFTVCGGRRVSNYTTFCDQIGKTEAMK